ncbi:hypothetical protein Tco_0424570 [Tanacetum coccineum]
MTPHHKSEPINAYFKNNRAVHRDYLKVNKEHIETLQELLKQARTVKPLDENLDYASKFAKKIQDLLVYVCASCPYAQSGNEEWAPATSLTLENLAVNKGSDEEPSDVGSPGVIVYAYDGLPIHPVAPPSPDYVLGPKHPPSLDYVSGPEHLPSPVYVPEPEYPEYLVPSDAEAHMEDQPLPDDASPTSLSPGYVADSDPEEDPKEDPEEDHADYPADGGDGDDESSDDDDDDDDDDDEDEEASENEDDNEEEEHLALADSSTVPVVDPVPSAEDTEAFETDESAPTPPSSRSPQIVVPLS